MSDKVKYHLLDIVARIGAVIPPLVTSLYFFPEWIRKSSGATFSGMALVVFLVLMIPMWRKVFDAIKGIRVTDASMPVFWIVFCGVLFVLRSIVDRMLYIGLAGLLGSMISAGICVARNKYRHAIQEESGRNREI